MEDKNKENSASNQKTDTINSNLITVSTAKFLKLISKFGNEYDKTIKEWEVYPDNEEINNPEKFSHYKKKLELTVKVLLKISEKKNDKNIVRILTFTHNLLSVEETYKSVTKLNLLLNNGITLLQLIEKKEESEINKIMQTYLTNIIRNFSYAYKNTFAFLLLTISNSLAVLNKIDSFFDFEVFFVNEDDYINKILIPKIKDEILRLGETFKDQDLIKEFELDKINYESDLSLLYLIQALCEFDELLKIKNNKSEKEYIDCKLKIKKKLYDEKLKRENGEKNISPE